MATRALFGGDRGFGAGDLCPQCRDVGVEITDAQRVKNPLFNEDLLFWPRFFVIQHRYRP